MKPTGRLSAVAIAVALLASYSIAQQEAQYKELPNFHKVNSKLYRGAQPQPGGIKRLAELGIKSIVDLRGEDDRSHAERKEAEAAGVRYFNIALPGLSAPSEEQVAKIMKVIDTPDYQPVFVHCKRGSDRTGTIVACYRIDSEGWTAERAISEARMHGMSWLEFGMRGYVSDYYKRSARRPVVEPAAAISR
jgi:tyrosine-protein phosphatase SIW14